MKPPTAVCSRTRRGSSLRRAAVFVTAAWLLPLPIDGRAPPETFSAAPVSASVRGIAQDGTDRPQDPEAIVRAAVAFVGEGELDRAATILSDALERWPDHPELLAGLAGVRLRQGRAAEAEALADRLTRAEPASGRGWELLAASRYLQDDRWGALRAWRRHRPPEVRDVDLRVLAHDGPRTSGIVPDPARLTGIAEGSPLTVDVLVQGERRLAALPAGSRARLGYRALPSGDVAVEGTVVLGMDDPFTLPGLAGHALRAAVGRVHLVSSDPLGRFERWELSGYREGTLRSVGLSLAHPAPWVSGVWRWELDHEAGRYGSPASDEPISERRSGLAWSHADWVTARLRGSVHGRVDLRPDRGTFAGAGAGWTLLTLDGRTSLRLEGTGWTRVGGGADRPAEAANFGRLAFEALLHPPEASGGAAPSGLALRGGIVAVSSGAPHDLLPRIGAGGNTSLLMRARSDLGDDGVIRPLYPGRSWAHGGIEVLRAVGSVGPLGIGVAAFADGVRVLGGVPGAFNPAGRRGAVHLGAGLRVRIPMVSGWLRADWGIDPSDGASTVSAAWVAGALR